MGQSITAAAPEDAPEDAPEHTSGRGDTGTMSRGNNPALPMAGQCRCGQLSYRVSQPPLFTLACHCTDCQQLSSSAFSLGMVVPADGFALQGEPACWEKTGESGGWSRQFSCPRCSGWTHTITQHAPGVVIVRPSTLEDHSWFRPVAQIFTRSALPWARLNLPLSFAAEFADPQPLREAFAAAMAAPAARESLVQAAEDLPQLGMPEPAKGGEPAPDAVRKDKVSGQPHEREAGRYARAPHEIPLPGWWSVLKRTGAGFIQDRIMAEAASVTFYALLALFPAIAALISIYGLFTDPSTLNAELANLGDVVPGGGLQLIQSQITALTAKGHGALGFAAIIGLGVSLWSANSGIKSLIDALNVVYHEHEKRSYVKLTLLSLAFTMGTIVFVIVALFAVVAVPIILNFVGLGFATAALINVLRWPAMLMVVAFALSVIYRYAPSRNWARWQWVSWGGFAAAVLWIVVSLLFSFYVANFGNYNKTYGSLGAVVGFMTWIWISSIVVLMGAELNAELEQQTEHDSTVGPEKPQGERGAYKADVKV
jgi:membrane protein